jgi:hypothetical protein
MPKAAEKIARIFWGPVTAAAEGVAVATVDKVVGVVEVEVVLVEVGVEDVLVDCTCEDKDKDVIEVVEVVSSCEYVLLRVGVGVGVGSGVGVDVGVGAGVGVGVGFGFQMVVGVKSGLDAPLMFQLPVRTPPGREGEELE